MNAAQLADAAEVVANKVGDHQILGARLLIGLQRFGAAGVLASVGAALAGPLNRLRFNDPFRADTEKAFRR